MSRVAHWRQIFGGIVAGLLLLPFPAFAVTWTSDWVLESSVNATYSPTVGGGDNLLIFSTISGGSVTQPTMSITLHRTFTGADGDFDVAISNTSGGKINMGTGSGTLQGDLVADVQIDGASLTSLPYTQHGGNIPSTNQFATGHANNIVNSQSYTVTVTFSITGTTWTVPSSSPGGLVTFAFSN